jgi:hypothetical protein
MRGAFVLKLASGTEPRHGRFEGWIEEVDSGRELRFRSTEELLAFLSKCFDEARRRDCRADRENSVSRERMRQTHGSSE